MNPVSIALALVALAAQGVPDSRSELTINLYSSAGMKAPPGKVTVRSTMGSFTASASGRDVFKFQVPFGEYIINFEGQFAKPVERRIDVNRTQKFVVLGVDVADSVLDVRNNPVEITITVHPASPCAGAGFLWAKLVGAFSDLSQEVKVGAYGNALFDPVPPGRYVIFIIEGNTIRATKALVTSGALSHIDVTASACE